MTSKSSLCRPGERRDPYRVISLGGTVADTFRNHARRWLWVPAFAGTTRGESVPSSPSLPWRDDFDLVAVLDRGFGPAAFRQHVVVQRDCKMGAFIFELAEQRVDPRRTDLALLAVDPHTHCITSLSIVPRA